MSEFETIRLHKNGSCLEITLDRPESLNAIDERLVDDLDRALDRAEADDDCRVVIVTGAGRAFCAGSDIAALGGLDSKRGLEHVTRLTAVIGRLETLRQPVIAAVNGPCFGGGLEIALGCTLRVAVESARFGLPEVKIGVIPGAGGMERLQRLIGFGRTAHLALTGRGVEAKQAEAMGMIDIVCPDGEALQAARDLAAGMLACAPLALRAAKQCLYAARDTSVEDAVDHSMRECCKLFDTKDKAEGVAAFLEKRKPRFKGE